jgi:phage terminase large subunit-like protein
MACGTRYHPSDIYDTWRNQEYDVFNADYEIIDKKSVWEIKEYKVETDMVFIWPSVIRPEDNKMYGYNPAILNRIKAEYEDKVQFHAQYYNDPNDPGSARISQEKFQYYDAKYLKSKNGTWYFRGRRLNVYASVDFAFSLNKGADYTAIVVIGIDCDGHIYVLDIDRFKSDRTKEYFDHIKRLHSKWSFRKLRAEVTVAQKVIVNDIKDFVKKDGLRLAVEDFRPSRKEGSKEERISAALEWRYDDMIMWHPVGGYVQVLEEELMQARPKNDDVKDALASAIEIAVKPKQTHGALDVGALFGGDNKKRSRFGGVAF